ncbi:MAG: hypothetical protein K9M44_01930 [Candidatus Pacebacteria bacterium]|nr:hypothetical protein [Candidatus Paceibacterota bacterium]
MIKKMLENSYKFWYQIVNFWTLFFMAIIVVDLFSSNKQSSLVSALAIIYIGVLAIYVGNKEFERWYHLHQGRHPGEMYVILWTVLIASLLACDLIMQTNYSLPGAVISAYLTVLTLLVITNKSKNLYRKSLPNRRKTKKTG